MGLPVMGLPVMGLSVMGLSVMGLSVLGLPVLRLPSVAPASVGPASEGPASDGQLHDGCARIGGRRVGAVPRFLPDSVHGSTWGCIRLATRHIGDMTVRDSWQVHLRCPACGVVGEAEVSEDAQPFMPPAGTFRVDRVPDGFRIRKLGVTMRTTQFECIQCGALTQR
jgi:predicted RNA-binding Zn-ribbon protein involved in translation (DUF1610 family)